MFLIFLSLMLYQNLFAQEKNIKPSIKDEREGMIQKEGEETKDGSKDINNITQPDSTKNSKEDNENNIENIETEKVTIENGQTEDKDFEREKKLADRIEKIIDYGTHKERKRAINNILLIKNVELKDKLEKKLIDTIRDEIDSDVKVKAITVAGELELAMAIPELQDSLNDESEDVQIAAVYAIKKIGDQSTKQSLILKFKEQSLDNNSILIEALIDTLGEFNAVELREYAIKAIEDDNTTKDIRELLVLFLGNIGSIESKDFLIKLLKDEEEEKGIRAFAANSIARLGIREAAGDIDEIVKQIESYSYKKKKRYYNLYIYCIAALAKIGDEKAIPRLINSLRSDSSIVRLRAINLIKELNDSRAIDILKYKMKHDPSPRVQSSAKKALEELGVIIDNKKREVKEMGQEEENISMPSEKEPNE
ncbi:MAG: HEAT repeat domain-containing protein [Spirochaetota bacterium]|nr:HEAT repeat domain-containing protein [Spirochaetota bacterium]